MSDNRSLPRNGRLLEANRKNARTVLPLGDSTVRRDSGYVAESLEDTEQQRAGTSDSEDCSTDNVLTADYQPFQSTFEHLYNALLQQTTNTRTHSTPTPCSEAWMQLARLLQMRSSYLEHEVRELWDANQSLSEDVDWHVRALGELEGRLSDVRGEWVGGLEKLRDSGWRMGDERDGASLAADDGSCTTSSRSSTSYLGSDEDAADIPTISAPQTPTHPPPALASPPAPGFCFSLKSSVITLATSPPVSFQWPPGTTLNGARTDLISRHERGVEGDVHLARILEIMDQREISGLRLPEVDRDGVIWVGVPDAGSAGLEEGDVGVGASRACGRDAGPYGWGCECDDIDNGFRGGAHSDYGAVEMDVPALLCREGSRDGLDGPYPADQVHRRYHDGTWFEFLESLESTPTAFSPGEYYIADTYVFEEPFQALNMCVHCGMPDPHDVDWGDSAGLVQ